MTRSDAEALALQVRTTTGQNARVEFEDEDHGFLVVVPVTQPRSGALREEFFLYDELDWGWLRDRIASA